MTDAQRKRLMKMSITNLDIRAGLVQLRLAELVVELVRKRCADAAMGWAPDLRGALKGYDDMKGQP